MTDAPSTSSLGSDELVDRAIAATKVPDRRLLARDQLWRIYTVLFGGAVSLIQARWLVELRDVPAAGPFRRHHAELLHEELRNIGAHSRANVDWLASPVLGLWAAGHLLNDAIQRNAIVTDRTLAVLEQLRGLTKGKTPSISRRLKLLAKGTYADPLRTLLNGVSSAFAEDQQKGRPEYVQTVIRDRLRLFPPNARLRDVEAVVPDPPQDALAFCWARSNIWKHRPEGTHERGDSAATGPSGNASLLEWVWALRGLEHAAALWQAVSTHVINQGEAMNSAG